MNRKPANARVQTTQRSKIRFIAAVSSKNGGFCTDGILCVMSSQYREDFISGTVKHLQMHPYIGIWRFRTFLS